MKAKMRLPFSFLVLFLGAFIFCATRWLGKHFGDIGTDQLLYHLNFGLKGLLKTDENMIASFVRSCVRAPLIVTIVLFGVLHFLKKYRSIKTRWLFALPVGSLVFFAWQIHFSYSPNPTRPGTHTINREFDNASCRVTRFFQNLHKGNMLL